MGGGRGVVVDGVAVCGTGCWATRDGRESLEVVMLVLGCEDVGNGWWWFRVPEDLEGDGVRLLDGIVGGIALVAHVCGFMLLGYMQDYLGVLSGGVKVSLD